jgi:TetR/AcrR family tetracycline transcriptional repressor
VIADCARERAPVSREAVVGAALALLAEGGLEAVSFRRIAKVLGVSGPTLYWHVENKRQLMDLMAEELVRRTGRAYEGPEKGQPWWEWLRADAQRMFEALIATRDAPRVLAGNRPSRESFDGIERVLGELVAAAGMTPGQAQQTLFTIGAYVIGPADQELNAQRAEALADKPVLLAAINERLAGPFSATFEYGLDLLITGLRTRYVPADDPDRVSAAAARGIESG